MKIGIYGISIQRLDSFIAADVLLPGGKKFPFMVISAEVAEKSPDVYKKWEEAVLTLVALYVEEHYGKEVDFTGLFTDDKH